MWSQCQNLSEKLSFKQTLKNSILKKMQSKLKKAHFLQEIKKLKICNKLTENSSNFVGVENTTAFFVSTHFAWVKTPLYKVKTGLGERDYIVFLENKNAATARAEVIDLKSLGLSFKSIKSDFSFAVINNILEAPDFYLYKKKLEHELSVDSLSIVDVYLNVHETTLFIKMNYKVNVSPVLSSGRYYFLGEQTLDYQLL